MSFIPEKEVPTHTLRRAVIGNSQTVGIGYAVQPGATGHTSAVVAAGASNPVLGVIVSIEGNGGQVLEKSSLTTASNNETVGLIKAVYIPSSLPVNYIADFDAAATGDSLGASWFNLVAGGSTLDHTSGALFGGTQGQFWSYGQVTEPVSNTSKCIGHWSKTL